MREIRFLIPALIFYIGLIVALGQQHVDYLKQDILFGSIFVSAGFGYLISQISMLAIAFFDFLKRKISRDRASFYFRNIKRKIELIKQDYPDLQYDSERLNMNLFYVLHSRMRKNIKEWIERRYLVVGANINAITAIILTLFFYRIVIGWWPSKDIIALIIIFLLVLYLVIRLVWDEHAQALDYWFEETFNRIRHETKEEGGAAMSNIFGDWYNELGGPSQITESNFHLKASAIEILLFYISLVGVFAFLLFVWFSNVFQWKYLLLFVTLPIWMFLRSSRKDMHATANWVAAIFGAIGGAALVIVSRIILK